MGLIKEPLEVDFVVDPRPLTDKERKMISDFIKADKTKRAKTIERLKKNQKGPDQSKSELTRHYTQQRSFFRSLCIHWHRTIFTFKEVIVCLNDFCATVHHERPFCYHRLCIFATAKNESVSFGNARIIQVDCRTAI